MDRQDIDALLIGALYGELTPADEALLTAHLDSHPADKTALDDLKSARERVLASRIFDVQAEPPQAISAVLLQEAARRAPRRVATSDGNPSWFERFVRNFAAHPAIAAAAMLVVVVGVAGTLYMKNGSGGFAEKTESAQQVAPDEPAMVAAGVARPDNVVGGDASIAQVAEGKLGKDEGAAAAGSATYDVGLAERQQLDQRKEAETAKADRAKVAVATPKADDNADGDFVSKKQAVAHAGKSKGYVEVTTPQPQPKEMPPANDKLADRDPYANSVAGGGGAATGTANVPAQQGSIRGGTFAGPAPGGAPAPATTTAAAPPPPPADSKYAPAKPTAPPAKTVAKSPAPATQAEPPVVAQTGDTQLIAWAKDNHAKAIARVKAGDCSGAASYAVVVRNRAYGYYAQNMQNDRELKGCASYIADAVNKDEERSSKSKAAKSRASDEAPAATSK